MEGFIAILSDSYYGNFLLNVFFMLMAKVDELDKAIAVAAKDPARYSLDETELGKRRKWTSIARKQACICFFVLFLRWLQLTITSFLSYFYMGKAFCVFALNWRYYIQQHLKCVLFVCHHFYFNS